MHRTLLLMSAILVPAAVGATVLIEQSPQQIMRQADLVVLGHVVAQRSVRAQGTLMTESLVAVEETLKGPATRQVVISQLGGKDGNIEMDVPGDARLVPGQRVVLATYLHDDGRRYLVGMALGAFVIEGQRAMQTVDAPLVTPGGGVQAPPGVRILSLTNLRALAGSAR